MMVVYSTSFHGQGSEMVMARVSPAGLWVTDHSEHLNPQIAFLENCFANGQETLPIFEFATFGYC